MSSAVSDRIEKRILLRSPVERVWRALTDADEFGQWFGVRFDGPFKVGQQAHGVITTTTVDPEVAREQAPYAGLPFDITIERMDAQSRFSFRWCPFEFEAGVDHSKEPTTLVEFTLVPVDEGVHLTVVESGFDGIPLERRTKAFTANEGGWTMMIRVIEKYVAQRL